MPVWWSCDWHAAMTTQHEGSPAHGCVVSLCPRVCSLQFCWCLARCCAARAARDARRGAGVLFSAQLPLTSLWRRRRVTPVVRAARCSLWCCSDDDEDDDAAVGVRELWLRGRAMVALGHVSLRGAVSAAASVLFDPRGGPSTRPRDSPYRAGVYDVAISRFLDPPVSCVDARRCAATPADVLFWCVVPACWLRRRHAPRRRRRHASPPALTHHVVRRLLRRRRPWSRRARSCACFRAC
jgi:hypothetical protein